MKKKLFLLMGFALMAMCANAQVDGSMEYAPDSISENGEWSEVIQSEYTAKEAFKYAQGALASIVPNYQKRVQLADESNGKIICSVSMDLSATENVTDVNLLLLGSYNLTFTMLVKDKRFRVKGENVTCSYKTKVAGGSVIDFTDDERFLITLARVGKSLNTDYKKMVSSFLSTLVQEMKKQKDDDDF